MKTVYLTGGTGFLGSHFIRNYLCSREYDVRCFVRGDSEQACGQRIRQTILAVNTSYPGNTRLDLDRVSAVRADITLPRFGLGEAELDAIRGSGASTFFHFAASLHFEEKNRDAIYDHNVNGLRHAVEVASRLECAAFFYISTAYTVGVHDGYVTEQLHRPAAFNNYYEETKCAAEHLITELCAAGGMRPVIVRPSVVIGPSQSCQTGGSKTGLYGLIRDMQRLKPFLEQTQAPVVAYFNPDAGVNFIPVDYVCHDIFRLFADPQPQTGPHHATADNNVKIADLVELIARHLQLPKVAQERLECFDAVRASALEKLLSRSMAYYNSITRTTKHFEKNAGAKWTLGMDELERYVVEAVSQYKSS